MESEDEDIGVVYAQITPYQDEPLAEEDDEENGERNEEADLDGLPPAVLEARYEREVSVESWYALFYAHTFFTIALSFVCDSRARCFGISLSEISWHLSHCL